MCVGIGYYAVDLRRHYCQEVDRFVEFYAIAYRQFNQPASGLKARTAIILPAI